MVHFNEYLKEKELSKENYITYVLNDINNMEDIPKELSECICCERHRINFPKKLEPWIETKNGNLGNEIEKRCHFSPKPTPKSNPRLNPAAASAPIPAKAI